MNLKALITTLALVGSSSAAMADSFTISGSVKVNLGQPARPAPAPVYHAPVVVTDDCADPYNNRPDPRPSTPAYHPTTPVVVVQPPTPPVYRGPWFNPTNTTVGVSKSIYTGSITTSRMHLQRNAYGKAMWKRPATWFDLTEATRIDSGREQFNIGADKGTFKSLKLQGLGGGSSLISHVSIEYTDGKKTKQKVVLNRQLDAAHPIAIDLDGSYRSIARIIVHGTTARGSAYKILAM